MPSYNKVLLMGHMTRDPQMKQLPSGTALAEFGLACNRKFKTAGGEEREEVLFVDVTAFGRTAEVINQYFTKGKPIFIEGRLKLDTWEAKDGGGKRSKISVVADSFQFVGGNAGGGDDAPRQQQQRPKAGKGETPFQEEPPGFEDADIPF